MAAMWVTLSVHGDAFRRETGAYLIAVWWRLRGKRVRSRNQFALLLGRSSKAYSLWILRQESASVASGLDSPDPQIIALVDVATSKAGLQQTLQSLSDEGIIVHLVGAQPLAALASARDKIDWSCAPWLLTLSAGDLLAPGAATFYRNAINSAETRIVYADDDLIDKTGRCCSPHFKPSWNPELFQHFDYLSGSCLLRPSIEEFDICLDASDWAGELVRHLTKKEVPLHLQRVLHHRSTRRETLVPALPRIHDHELPPVTIIVPTRNRVDLLKTCLDGIAKTEYPNLKTIVVDNGSDDAETLSYLNSLDPARHRVVRHHGPFNFSSINNRAVAEAEGRLLCLLNNDIEVIEPDWLRIMAHQALRDDVGAVGAKLFYPEGRIQHAGVVIGVGNAAGHAHRFLRNEEAGYFCRHLVPQFVSAVTAACLVVQRDRFLAVGGLDEENFAVAFNDVDLCLKLNRQGWQSLYEPRATLVHHESVSRGFDRDPIGAARFASELAALQSRWLTDVVVDPFHHPQLSRASEQFVVAL